MRITNEWPSLYARWALETEDRDKRYTTDPGELSRGCGWEDGKEEEECGQANTAESVAICFHPHNAFDNLIHVPSAAAFYFYGVYGALS